MALIRIAAVAALLIGAHAQADAPPQAGVVDHTCVRGVLTELVIVVAPHERPAYLTITIDPTVCGTPT